MTDDGKRKQSAAQSEALDQAYRAERRRVWTRSVALAFVGFVLAGLFIWFTTSRGVVVEIARLEGTVVSWSRSQDYTGSSTLFVTVKLSDGRQVVATSNQSLAPKSGDQTLVQERVYESGARKFMWPAKQSRE